MGPGCFDWNFGLVLGGGPTFKNRAHLGFHHLGGENSLMMNVFCWNQLL